MSLKVRSRKVNGVVILDMYGRITSGEPLMLLRSTIRRFVDDGNDRFVLNLSDVNFVDSSGLGELIWTKSSLAKQGGHVNLLGLGKRVKDLLVMSKLMVVFDVFDDEAKAVAALERSASHDPTTEHTDAEHVSKAAVGTDVG
jgi:anti-sigma B factor antagonist